MPDILDRYPIIDRGVFASGEIRSDADPDLCIESLPGVVKVELRKCSNNLSNRSPQSFTLNWHRIIQIYSTGVC